MSKQKNQLKLILSGALTVIISVLIVVAIVKASGGYGTLTPSGAPTIATGYTLDDIYNRLNSNTPATAGNHTLTAGATSSDPFHTIVDIYNKIPIINAGNLLSSTTYLGVTGNIAIRGAFGLKGSTTDQSVVAGYYSGGTLSGAATLIAGNVKSGVNIFGTIGNYSGGGGYTYGSSSATQVLTTAGAGAGTFNATHLSNSLIATGTAWGVGQVGTLLGHEYTGSAGTSVSDYAYYPLNNFTSLVGASNTVLGFFGGVDDWNANDGGSRPAGAYFGGWYGAAGSCNAGNSYCGAGASAVSADNKDLSTGLVWSMPMDSANTHTWFWANNCYEPLTPAHNPVDCQNNGDAGCRCIKKPSGSKVGCESLDGGGIWRTPTQKELMQVYIDGSDKYLSSPHNSFWSATTKSNDTSNSWYGYLMFGDLSYDIKTNNGSHTVLCVK